MPRTPVKGHTNYDHTFTDSTQTKHIHTQSLCVQVNIYTLIHIEVYTHTHMQYAICTHARMHAQAYKQNCACEHRQACVHTYTTCGSV